MYRPRKLVFHIKELTEKYNIAQNELARRASIEPARLSELANGRRKQIEISYIVKIAEELDITDINEIMSLEYINEKD
ncbi:helix-turn-helix domain-containing protein [Amphibacillus sp. Q70]|uniref:helix-turn-helix domain-containing protein n=1 Tax=Amphibacillus sp. Q70 TaxID=3453416 RepID=UPI003F878C09